jgi:hypothetical protein
MNWKRLWMASVILFLLSPLVFGATLVINRVTTYTDGTPIPEELINTMQYRYYYGETVLGPFIEGTFTIDNLVIQNLPETSPGIPSTGVGSFPVLGVPYFYTVDVESEGVRSDKAPAQPVIIAVTPPSGGGTKSPGCALRS